MVLCTNKYIWHRTTGRWIQSSYLHERQGEVFCAVCRQLVCMLCTRTCESRCKQPVCTQCAKFCQGLTCLKMVCGRDQNVCKDGLQTCFECEAKVCCAVMCNYASCKNVACDSCLTTCEHCESDWTRFCRDCRVVNSQTRHEGCEEPDLEEEDNETTVLHTASEQTDEQKSEMPLHNARSINDTPEEVSTKKEKDAPLPHLPTEPRNGRYRHYKGKEYRVVGRGRHSETLEPMVVYEALFDTHDLWIRPVTLFMEHVMKQKNMEPRFVFVSEY